MSENENIISFGLDVGTMNICLASSESKDVKITRNVFLTINKDDIDINELTDINHVVSEDGSVFIIGEDAFKFANIFGQEVSRPMQSGLISPKELSAIDVLALIVKNLIGDVSNKIAYCSYSVPASSVDESNSVTYHERVFSRIINSLGVNSKSVNEAMAIIYSECAKEQFSGIGISFGAGMANIACAYKGIEAVKFSTARSGDWIDFNVAQSLNMVQNRVTSIKEKYLNLATGYQNEENKKTRRVLEALYYYYETLVDYTIKKMINEFENNLKIQIDEKIPVVISGGTSLPEGFLELFKTGLSKNQLSFEISEVRRASNPLTAVSNGLLIKTISDLKRINK